MRDVQAAVLCVCADVVAGAESADHAAVVDAARRERPTAELSVEPAGEDERPAVEELEPLTGDLPPKERAAVVLRYGYDLDYDTIGAALGSNEQAARQAASAGVRRLRKEKEQR